MQGRGVTATYRHRGQLHERDEGVRARHVCHGALVDAIAAQRRYMRPIRAQPLSIYNLMVPDQELGNKLELLKLTLSYALHCIQSKISKYTLPIVYHSTSFSL